MAAKARDRAEAAVQGDLLLQATSEEQSLCGAAIRGAMEGSDVITDVRGTDLLPHFGDRVCRSLWEIICGMRDADRSIDLQTVARSAQEARVVDAGSVVDWMGRVSEWADDGIPALARDHARKIREASARREILAQCRALAAVVKQDSHPLAQTVPAHFGKLLQVDLERERERTFGEVLQNTVEWIGRVRSGQEVPGLPTGLSDLDAQLVGGGLRPGELVIVAARTSMGKSSLMYTWMLHWLLAGTGVGLISAEMYQDEVDVRLLSQYTGIPISAMYGGQMAEAEWTRLQAAATELRDLPMQVCDDERSWTAVMNRIRVMADRSARVIVVDYLGLISVPSKSAYRRDRVQEVTQIAQDARNLAKRLHVPIVIVVQINREAVRDKDKRPQPHHLREAGALEEHADKVLMLYRDSVYNPDADPTRAEILLRKQRNGPCGTVIARWHGQTAGFANWVPDAEDCVEWGT